MAFLNKNEYEAMLEAGAGFDYISSRDKMMIMHNTTGCRVSDLVNLCVSDIFLPPDNTTPSILFLAKDERKGARQSGKLQHHI